MKLTSLFALVHCFALKNPKPFAHAEMDTVPGKIQSIDARAVTAHLLANSNGQMLISTNGRDIQTMWKSSHSYAVMWSANKRTLILFDAAYSKQNVFQDSHPVIVNGEHVGISKFNDAIDEFLYKAGTKAEMYFVVSEDSSETLKMRVDFQNMALSWPTLVDQPLSILVANWQSRFSEKSIMTLTGKPAESALKIGESYVSLKWNPR